MDLLNLLKAALLGVVQGLTEFLPISSTAHLLLGADLLGYEDPGGVFTVMIQLGSILAVMWLYRAKIVEVVVGLPTKPEARRFALMLFLAFIPAMLAGLFAGDYVRTVLYESLRVIAAAFVLGGLVMLAIERWAPKVVVHQADQTPIARAIGVGIIQCVALIPGVSRSGATIVGGLLMGLDRRAAAEFSFFLAMPTMVAAFTYDVLQMRDHPLPTERLAEIGVGFVMAFIAAAVVVKPFLDFVTRVGFAPFAWYRIALGLIIFAGLGLGWFA
ncbi:MAG: undecaprenyl-diphosphate phosphatase [Hyphomonadaceae bacterium]